MCYIIHLIDKFLWCKKKNNKPFQVTVIMINFL